MSGFLLDTNVVSETMKQVPAPQVIDFLEHSEETWLASLVVHELEYGVDLMSEGKRRERVRAGLVALLREYEDRVLPLNVDGARWAAWFRADAIRSGRNPELSDMLIAGTAKAHGLALATRNVRDFEGLGVEVVNPWAER